MSRLRYSGQAWLFGDQIDTDVLAPGRYMKGDLATLAAHCLESIEPRFATQVKPGDIVVGGKNFGIGSSREQAAMALKHLHVGAIVARSFGGIFFRNAINIGLPLIEYPLALPVQTGQEVIVDVRLGHIELPDNGQRYDCPRMPDHLLAILESGGLIGYLLQQQARPTNP